MSNEKNLPVKWTTEENVAWKVAMPGFERIDADHLARSYLSERCRGRQSVSLVRQQNEWRSPLEEATRRRQRQNAQAEHVVAVARHRRRNVYVMTGTGILKGFDFNGKELWSRDIQKEYGQFGLELGLRFVAAAV